MKRLAWLLLLPLASSALFAQVTITPASLPSGTVGVFYSQGLSVSPSGTATWAWSVTQGSLPSGLTISPSGNTTTISGTPTTAGSYSFTVQASFAGTLANGITVTHDYTVVIAAAYVPPVTISPSSLPSDPYGSQYRQDLTASGGYGPGTYTFSLDPASPGPLPPGLGISTTGASTGTISGTPTQPGTFPFTVRATSQTYNNPIVYGTQTYSITITGSPLTITTAGLPGGTVGIVYSQNLAATGGTQPYTWQWTGGSLPGGLVLDAPTGNIHGTPTAAGSFAFQVTVTDSLQASAKANFTVTIVAAALIITTSSLPAGTVGTSYTATTLAATGGIPPYTWSASGLPSGLSISSAGVISGTPTAAGSFSVTVQATDSAQVTATKALTLTVAGELTITTATLPNGTVGTSYTATTLAATGGTPPYSWSASGLPSGLSMSSAGVISGTPAAAGSFSVSVQVTDAAKATATKAFTITVTVLTITTATLPNGTVGTAYTATTLAATGGAPPYTWSASGLPSGLSMSAAGVISGTPGAAGSFSVTVKVTDSAQATATQAFTITVAAALTITTTALPNGTAGIPYTATTLAASGGAPPYTWSASGLPSALSISAAGVISGTPAVAGSFSVTVKVTDSAQATATQAFTITVAAALTITTATLPNGTVGAAYSQTLAAAGGSGTLAWSISTGALPGGITLSSAGSLSGTPTAPGTFNFTVSVTGGGQSASKAFTITVGVPAGPAATITGLPATGTPATQPVVGITIPNAYPLDITGTVTLTFAPDSPSPDGGEVVFTTGGRTASFTVPANTTQAVFTGNKVPGVQTGTVSGTITLTLDLTAAGIDVTPSPAPSTKITIAKSAPVIISGGVTVSPTTGGFNIVVVGYATSREMVSATVTFTAASGVTLSSSSATISLASVFTTWYQSSASAQYGSNFSLTMPFTIANGTSTNSLTSVSVQLTNAVGNSTSVSAASH
jgi:hypothetical protein